jgi:hypothetical protein
VSRCSFALALFAYAHAPVTSASPAPSM